MKATRSHAQPVAQEETIAQCKEKQCQAFGKPGKSATIFQTESKECDYFQHARPSATYRPCLMTYVDERETLPSGSEDLSGEVGCNNQQVICGDCQSKSLVCFQCWREFDDRYKVSYQIVDEIQNGSYVGMNGK